MVRPLAPLPRMQSSLFLPLEPFPPRGGPAPRSPLLPSSNVDVFVPEPHAVNLGTVRQIECSKPCTKQDVTCSKNRSNLRARKYARWYTTLGRFLEEPSSLLVEPHMAGGERVDADRKSFLVLPSVVNNQVQRMPCVVKTVVHAAIVVNVESKQ